MKTFQEYLNEATDDAIKSKESDASVVRKSMKRAAAKNTDGKHMEIKEDGFIYFA